MNDSRQRSHQPTKTSSTSTYILGGVAAVVLVALVVGGLVWNAHRHRGGVSEQVLAQNASLVVGRQDAPLTIDVFEDFQCPVCKQFEAKSGQAISDAVDAGKIRVRYHILTFLDSHSGSGDYSSRAAGAALCVAELEPQETWRRYHSVLYERQPAENGKDFSNDQLADIAGEVGAGEPTKECIRTQSKIGQAKEFAKQSTEQLAKAQGGRAGTPSVLVAGRDIAGLTDGTGWLDKLIASSSTTG